MRKPAQHVLVVWFFFSILEQSSYRADAVNILVFGGNGFIGSECVTSLLSAGHNVTLVNRGSNYYDFETRVKPYVTHIKCDRYNKLQNCGLLMNIRYDIIIDFSAYRPLVIQDAVQYFGETIGTYIYISSDSVYEVSIPSQNEKSEESDAKRNPVKEEQLKANEKDEYGHFKLEGEEYLLQENELSGLQYVIIRLSDVIGPRDTTYRWWAYQMWFRLYGDTEHVLYLPESSQNFKSSYVYVKDIAKTLNKIVEDITLGEKKLLNQVLNFAHPLEMNLRTLLDSLQLVLKIQGVEYRYSKAPYYLYPSVTRGPINVTKIRSLVQYEPTPWLQAVQETVTFFDEAFTKFPSERDEMLTKLAFLTNRDLQSVKESVEQHTSKCSREEQRLPRDEF